MEKNKLIEKVQEGLSINGLSKYFNLSYTTIRYWLNKYNLKTTGYKKIHNWSQDKLLKAISKSECKSDILRNLNISTRSGNFQTLDRYCKKYKIDISHLKYKNNRGNKFKKIKTNEEFFVENSESIGKSVKKRIIQEKLIDYKCKKCNNDGNWMGKKLSLQLDHKNGINNDNRLLNLRFLCPNCHSQTKTYAAKNMNRK